MVAFLFGVVGKIIAAKMAEKVAGRISTAKDMASGKLSKGMKASATPNNPEALNDPNATTADYTPTQATPLEFSTTADPANPLAKRKMNINNPYLQ